MKKATKMLPIVLWTVVWSTAGIYGFRGAVPEIMSAGTAGMVLSAAMVLVLLALIPFSYVWTLRYAAGRSGGMRDTIHHTVMVWAVLPVCAPVFVLVCLLSGLTAEWLGGRTPAAALVSAVVSGAGSLFLLPVPIHLCATAALQDVRYGALLRAGLQNVKRGYWRTFIALTLAALAQTAFFLLTGPMPGVLSQAVRALGAAVLGTASTLWILAQYLSGAEKPRNGR